MRAAETRDDPPMSLDGFLAFPGERPKGSAGSWTTGCR